jgi:hypothetical protein
MYIKKKKERNVFLILKITYGFSLQYIYMIEHLSGKIKKRTFFRKKEKKKYQYYYFGAKGVISSIQSKN